MTIDDFEERFGGPLDDEQKEFWQQRSDDRNLSILQSCPLECAIINIDLLLGRNFSLAMSYYGRSSDPNLFQSYVANVGTGRYRRSFFTASDFKVRPALYSVPAPSGYENMLLANLKKINTDTSKRTLLENNLISLEYGRASGKLRSKNFLKEEVKRVLVKPEGWVKDDVYFCGERILHMLTDEEVELWDEDDERWWRKS